MAGAEAPALPTRRRRGPSDIDDDGGPAWLPRPTKLRQSSALKRNPPSHTVSEISGPASIRCLAHGTAPRTKERPVQCPGEVFYLPEMTGAEADRHLAACATWEPPPVVKYTSPSCDVGPAWEQCEHGGPRVSGPNRERIMGSGDCWRSGWGTWIRTKTARVRVGSSTVKLSPTRDPAGRAGGRAALLPLHLADRNHPPVESACPPSYITGRCTLRRRRGWRDRKRYRKGDGPASPA